MSAHKPDIVTRQLVDGRWFSQCLGCMEHSTPSFHKPIAEDWRKAHAKSAPQTETKEHR